MKVSKIFVLLFLISVSFMLTLIFRFELPKVSSHPETIIENNMEQKNEKIIRDIDARISYIDEEIGFDFYQDHYDGDILIYKGIEHDIGLETYTWYFLYYNENEELIYADITHYRGPAYSIYFQNEELYLVKIESFHGGYIFVNGDLAHVMDVVGEEEYYSFILDDRARCLEYAKK